MPTQLPYTITYGHAAIACWNRHGAEGIYTSNPQLHIPGCIPPTTMDLRDIIELAANRYAAMSRSNAKHFHAPLRPQREEPRRAASGGYYS